MPKRELTQDRMAMYSLAGKDGPVPAYGGPRRRGIAALLVWAWRCRRMGVA